MVSFNCIYFCSKMINSLMNTKNPNMTNLCEIVYDHDMMQLIEGYYSVMVQKQDGNSVFHL